MYVRLFRAGVRAAVVHGAGLGCAGARACVPPLLGAVEVPDLFGCLIHPPAPTLYTTTQVGLVGYPNVGKSSTINALFGAKKTAVAPTPGKTKHFQTLNVSPSMCLCDCPGAVG